MNLIDIASWQQGMNLATMYQKNPKLDGVIVKVSQGTGYVNPQAKTWLDWLTSTGKIAGTYHYLDLAGAKEEARHYVESVKPWLGKVALAIDYEEATLGKGTGYLKECLDEVYRLTGVKPLVYCSQSVTQSQNFSAIAGAGYKLWVAQYADMNIVNGFVAKPWQKGSVAPFPCITMHQYTSCGHLEGWDKNLDFDLFYGDAADWAALCGGSAQPAPVPAPAPGKKGPDATVISEVLHGKYGNGQDRLNRLNAAGYDADAVQRKVNELYGIALSCKKKIAGNEKYLNSIDYLVRAL